MSLCGGLCSGGLAALALLSAPAAPAGLPAGCPDGATEPVRVILFLGDGAGTAHWSAALFAAGDLALRGFPVVGLVDTRNVTGSITDSGASATAYATAVRTYNRAIGVDSESAPLESVVDVAERRGMATGLVATSSVVHATPASFVAKATDRYAYDEIARQLADSQLEVLLGGGARYFDARTRSDTVDLLARVAERSALVLDAEALESLDADTIAVLTGLFASDEMPPAPSRQPSLAAMTAVALQVLARDQDGFFLMVEGSQIDWRAHRNSGMEALVAEVLDLDSAITVALRFAEEHPGTLIVVTADHETGGLALGEVTSADGERRLAPMWSSSHHTADLVPLFALGPEAERFGGIHTNDEIGRLLLDIVSGACEQN